MGNIVKRLKEKFGSNAKGTRIVRVIKSANPEAMGSIISDALEAGIPSEVSEDSENLGD